MTDDAYEDLGRRLAGAYASWRLGNKGIDYTVKQYADRPIGSFWIGLAKHIDGAAAASFEDPIEEA